MSDNNNTLIACEGCGGEFEISELTKTDAGYFCADCFESEFITCEDCGEIVKKDDAYQTDDGNWICENCRENYFYCDICEGLFPDDEGNYIESEEVCVCGHCLTNNYTRCDDCGEYVADNRIIGTANSESICRNCYENDYFTCEACGEVYHTDRYGSDGMCEDCADDDQSPSNVHSYSYTPSLVFHRGAGEAREGRLYFGVELELSHATGDDKINNIDSCVEILGGDDASNVYLKEDGSLERGFEIVSHPRTLQSWQEFRPVIEKYFDAAKNYSDGHRDGLHIHISRRGMSAPHIARLGAFIAACQDEITVIARRNAEQWAKYHKKPENGREVKATASTASRYTALNWCNASTAELRVFRATLDVDEFFAAIEFSHAAYQFTKNAIGIVEIVKGNPWQHFLAFLNSNKKRYETLIAFLRKQYATSKEQYGKYMDSLCKK